MKLNLPLLLVCLTNVIASFNPNNKDFNLGEQSLDKCSEIELSKKVLYDCSKREAPLKIHNVVLNPNPPKRGKKLEIKASGYTSEDILPGSKLKIAVKLGLIKLIELNYDLCDTVKDYGLECPVKKGPVNVTTSVDLPNEIPMGTFIVDAVATSNEKKELAHIIAKLHFSFN
ncbi:hypothetical protein K502DRAFT_323162 [Neoconidiobolus thromboides FSU 785]|nr:hypothetical protein K502DRAFT_323162 [Neoconidiobolus thromboides FSU 785]